MSKTPFEWTDEAGLHQLRVLDHANVGSRYRRPTKEDLLQALDESFLNGLALKSGLVRELETKLVASISTIDGLELTLESLRKQIEKLKAERHQPVAPVTRKLKK